MSKFNTVQKLKKVKAARKPKSTSTGKSRVTTNLAGGVAYTIKDKTELVTILLTSYVEDTFYNKGSDVATRVSALMKKVTDKKFIAKAAIYARNEFGMRSISHVVAGELGSECCADGT